MPGSYVSRTSAGGERRFSIHKNTVKAVSGESGGGGNLAQQEAIFVVEGASLPARVRIRNLTTEQLPRSQSAKFAEGWAGQGLSALELEIVTGRMVADYSDYKDFR